MLEYSFLNDLIIFNKLNNSKANFFKNNFLKLFFFRIEISFKLKKQNLNFEYFKILKYIFLNFFSNFSSLKKIKLLNILFSFLIFSYKGIRHLYSLPVNGQRTWSNKKNAKKCNKSLKLLLDEKKLKTDF